MKKRFGPLLRSIAVNGLGGFVVYQIAARFYPQGNAWPLVWSGIIPAYNLAYGLIVRRSVNFVAGLIFVDLLTRLSVAAITGSVTVVFIARGLREAVVAVIFAASVAFDRPLVAALARELVAGDDRRAAGEFARVAAEPRVHEAYRFATLVWAAALSAVSVALVVAALTLPPAAVYVVDAILAYAAYGALTVWTTRRIRAQRKAGVATATE